MKEQEPKSQTCGDCSDCRIRTKTLQNGIIQAAVVIEHFDEVIKVVKQVINNIDYAPEVHLLWDKYEKYREAIGKWKKAQRDVSEIRAESCEEGS